MGKVTSPIQVLIVGAGPPGLMMACQLARQNISFRIIDKSGQHDTGSGALVIHSRSLEIFSQMGLADKAISEGIVARKINVVFNGKQPLTLVMNKMGKGETKFPGLLLLEQSKTEQLLTDFLHSYGYRVERNSELTDFSEYDEGCTNIVRKPDGKSIVIRSKYLIAADGSQSFIRSQLKIPFSGHTYKLSLFVFDGKADIDLPHDEICFSFTEKSSTGIFPLKGGRWRIDGTIPMSISGKETIVFDDVEPGFASRNRLRIKLHEPERFSVFHSHQQYAGAFKYRRCFMIGDAAHVFSPVGAQGMNTGMQDAYNLSWKLVMVVKGYANESLLNTYQNERLPLAKNMIKTTDHVFRMVTSNEKADKKIRLQVAPFLLRFLFPALERHRIISRFVFNGISEIGIHYRNSPLSANGSSGLFRLNAPRPGDRFPYFTFMLGGKRVNIQDMVSEGLFHLIIFQGNSDPEAFKTYGSFYRAWLRLHFIPLDQGTLPLYVRFGIVKNGCYLVRPDMYIAHRSKNINKMKLENYLKNLSIVTPAV